MLVEFVHMHVAARLVHVDYKHMFQRCVAPLVPPHPHCGVGGGGGVGSMYMYA